MQSERRVMFLQCWLCADYSLLKETAQIHVLREVKHSNGNQVVHRCAQRLIVVACTLAKHDCSFGFWTVFQLIE